MMIMMMMTIKRMTREQIVKCALRHRQGER